MKFTPGLWHHDQWGHICAGEKIIGIAYEREMDELNFADLPQMNNAKMMAAAPEMLGILRSIMSQDLDECARAMERTKRLLERLNKEE